MASQKVANCAMSSVSGLLLYYVFSPWSSSPVLWLQSLVLFWSSPVLCPQSLVIISCTMSAVSGHLLYRVCWSLVISCTMSAVLSGHLLYCVRSLWSSALYCICPQSL
ncbi:unnamed protein product, partial [Staurois parvus]